MQQLIRAAQAMPARQLVDWATDRGDGRIGRRPPLAARRYQHEPWAPRAAQHTGDR